MQNVSTNTSGCYQWRVSLASIEDNMLDIMGFPASDTAKTYTGQSLFINGGKSTYMASRYRNTTEETFPTSSFKTIAGAGHWPHIESASEFMSHIEGFLGE